MSKYETLMGVPTRGLTYAKLTDHLREAEDCANMMAHLHQTEGNDADKLLAKGWLGVGELLQRLNHQVTQLAMRNMS